MQRRCPCCPKRLSEFKLRSQTFYSCPSGDGLLVHAEILPQFVRDSQLASALLAQLKAPKNQMIASERRCPECGSGFCSFTAPMFSGLLIDVCQKCQLFWFDQGEWEELQDAHYTPLFENRSDPAGKEAHHWQKDMLVSSQVDPGRADMMQALTGALQTDANVKSTQIPIVTILILVFAGLATAMARHHEGMFQRFAYQPQHPALHQISSLFIHGDWWHLWGNTAFFFVVGEELEWEVGPLKFIELFLFCEICGNLLYSFSGAENPSIGMSGAVMGVMAYYAISFPSRNILFSTFVRTQVMTFKIPAPLFSASYFAFDLIPVALHLTTTTNHVAHIGGALAGVLFYFAQNIWD